MLGIQWLSTLGTIRWNFKHLRMEFLFQGQRVVLRGTSQSELSWMSGKVMAKYVSHQDPYLNSVCCFGISASLSIMHCSDGQEQNNSVELQSVLEEYSDVFAEPKTLPPHRSFDHHIPLKDREVSVNVRPYRYPLSQKDVIESMIKELLDSGVIRPSHSPFSSPIVMVKKKDGSWRMSIDYRQLNKFTVKDKFPINVIEELIDELLGAKCFLNWISGLDIIKLECMKVMCTRLLSSPMKVIMSLWLCPLVSQMHHQHFKLL